MPTRRRLRSARRTGSHEWSRIAVRPNRESDNGTCRRLVSRSGRKIFGADEAGLDRGAHVVARRPRRCRMHVLSIHTWRPIGDDAPEQLTSPTIRSRSPRGSAGVSRLVNARPARIGTPSVVKKSGAIEICSAESHSLPVASALTGCRRPIAVQRDRGRGRRPRSTPGTRAMISSELRRRNPAACSGRDTVSNGFEVEADLGASRSLIAADHRRGDDQQARA